MGWRKPLYRALSLGWQGTQRQWAALETALRIITPLIVMVMVSVHSIVGWDFGVSLVPAWHSTIFAPYFVVGAVHSGVGLVAKSPGLAPHEPAIAAQQRVHLARLAWHGPLARMLMQPFRPVGPPRARVLLGTRQPLIERLRRALAVGPVLVLHFIGRIDHAGDVARAR